VAADARFEVVTSQGAVLAELWRAARVRTAAIDGDLPTLAVTVGVDGSILVPDIVVEPIDVPPIGGSSGGPGRIQRVTSPRATGSPR
jgi:hypothetical protein